MGSEESGPMKEALDRAKHDVPAGWYQHRKGGIYYVSGHSLQEETLAPLVHYVSFETQLSWTRTLANFLDKVDGVPRFVRCDAPAEDVDVSKVSLDIRAFATSITSHRKRETLRWIERIFAAYDKARFESFASAPMAEVAKAARACLLERPSKTVVLDDDFDPEEA